MTVKFKCPVCRKLVKAVDEYAGKEGKCPKCMKNIPKPERRSKETTNTFRAGDNLKGDS